MRSEVSFQNPASLQQRVTPWHGSDSKLFWVLLALPGVLQPVHSVHSKLHIWMETFQPFLHFYLIMPLWFNLEPIMLLDFRAPPMVAVPWQR